MEIFRYDNFNAVNEINSFLDIILEYSEEPLYTQEWDMTEKPLYTQEWDISPDKLDGILNRLSKSEVKKYFIKFLNGIKDLPNSIRKKKLALYSGAFIGLLGTGYLTSSDIDSQDVKVKEMISDINLNMDNVLKSKTKLDISDNIANKFKEHNRKSSFDLAQMGVKEIEAGYSDDRGDRGNWYRGRFIGTNHGVSAGLLAKMLGRTPTVNDMKNLKYEDALKVFRSTYWEDINLSEFRNQSVANILYDGSINQGRSAIGKIFINAMSDLGYDLDSETPFSIENINIANSVDSYKLFNAIKKQREIRYRESRTFKRHGDGWLKRLYNINFSK